MLREKVTIDGNEAAAYGTYKTNEIIAIASAKLLTPCRDGWRNTSTNP